jgi:hypothetical protein
MRPSAYLIAVACIILAATPAAAQTDRGTITGAISDPQALLFPVTVEARNSEPGLVPGGTAMQLYTGTIAGRNIPALSFDVRIQAVCPDRNYGFGGPDFAH